MNVGRYLRGEDRHVGTARTVKEQPMNEELIDVILDETAVGAGLSLLAGKLPDHPGSAIVCTSEMTASQIEAARSAHRLVVRRDGIGFALVYEWKRRKGATNEQA